MPLARTGATGTHFSPNMSYAVGLYGSTSTTE